MKKIRHFIFIFTILTIGAFTHYQAMACPSKTPVYLYEKGSSFITTYHGDAQQLQKANEYFKYLIKKYPDSPLGYLGISRTSIINAYQFDNYYSMDVIRNQALPFAVRALELGPLLPEVHINYSLLENIFDQHRENQELAQKYLTLLPEEPETFYLIGKYLYSQKDYIKALEFFQTALELGPSKDLSFKLLTRIGILYLNKLEKPQKAVTSFQKALEINPNAANIYHYLGISYLHLKQFKASVDTFAESLQFLSNALVQKYLLLAQGYLFEEKGQIDKAILYLEKAVGMGMQDSQLFYHLGNLYFESANYSKAYDHFKNVIDLRPEAYFDAYYFAGRSAQSLGESDLATDYFRKYLQLNRHGPQADWIRANIPDLTHKLPLD